LETVPAVIAFQRGQPVDGFTGAISETQLKGFLERLVGPLDADIKELNEAADAALDSGDLEEATRLYSEILLLDSTSLAAVAGLAKAKLTAGDLEGASALLDQLPASAQNDVRIAAVRAALELTQQAMEVGDIEPLLKQVADHPADHQARLELALALAAANRREEAADALLEIMRRDRKWEDDGARKQLLQFFEAWGPMDPDTIAARRKLSGLLYS
jgi:putative thioredoxin